MPREISHEGHYESRDEARTLRDEGDMHKVWYRNVQDSRKGR